MKFKEQIIVKLAGLLKVNLLGTAYKTRGIGLPNDFKKNGENYFLKHYLYKFLDDENNLTFFDVGQNKGDYTHTLLNMYPNAIIHGFEPNSYLHKELSDRFIKNQNVRLNTFGFGKKRESLSLFTTREDKTTGHGSIFKSTMTDLHKNYDTEEIEIKLDTISNYCIKQNISRIDFLKIDVEGNELSVLIGAGDIINNTRVIQFEFNEMNVVSRSFLKDFYDLMPDFRFYRLLPRGLFPLGDYSSKYEVFTIQNIVAINKGL